MSENADMPASPVTQVARGDWLETINARGELVAADSQPLMLSPLSRLPRTLIWLAEDGTRVQAGQKVAAFSVAIPEKELASAKLAIRKLDIEMRQQQQAFALSNRKMLRQLEYLKAALEQARRYENETATQAMSHQEWIDHQQDAEWLRTRIRYLKKQMKTAADKHKATLASLQAKKTTQKKRLQQNRKLLDESVVLAPVAGLLSHRKNWGGQWITAGQTLFPGNVFADIAQPDSVIAALLVAENEGGFVKPGQKVRLWPEARPEMLASGEVMHRSPVATPVSSDNPTRFYRVQVRLDEQAGEVLRGQTAPGTRVDAEIQLIKKGGVIALANAFIQHDQSLLQSGNHLPEGMAFAGKSPDGPAAWVWRQRNGIIRKQSVRLGMSGPYRSEVVAGLVVGDKVWMDSAQANASGSLSDGQDVSHE